VYLTIISTDDADMYIDDAPYVSLQNRWITGTISGGFALKVMILGGSDGEGGSTGGPGVQQLWSVKARLSTTTEKNTSNWESLFSIIVTSYQSLRPTHAPFLQQKYCPDEE
jgi:hypothetical protein